MFVSPKNLWVSGLGEAPRRARSASTRQLSTISIAPTAGIDQSGITGRHREAKLARLTAAAPTVIGSQKMNVAAIRKVTPLQLQAASSMPSTGTAATFSLLRRTPLSSSLPITALVKSQLAPTPSTAAPATQAAAQQVLAQTSSPLTAAPTSSTGTTGGGGGGGGGGDDTTPTDTSSTDTPAPTGWAALSPTMKLGIVGGAVGVFLLYKMTKRR